jgi:sterol 14-demethylase
MEFSIHSEELYQEQKEKFGNPDGTFRDLTYEELRDLPLLDSVIRETLRLVSASRPSLRPSRDLTVKIS